MEKYLQTKLEEGKEQYNSQNRISKNTIKKDGKWGKTDINIYLLKGCFQFHRKTNYLKMLRGN